MRFETALNKHILTLSRRNHTFGVVAELVNLLKIKIMTKKNKIGYWIMMISLLTMIVVLLGFGDKKLYAICHVPLLIGLYMYK